MCGVTAAAALVVVADEQHHGRRDTAQKAQDDRQNNQSAALAFAALIPLHAATIVSGGCTAFRGYRRRHRNC